MPRHLWWSAWIALLGLTHPCLAGMTVDLRTNSLPTWYGGVPFEEVGWAAAACDLDGDGAADLVFTAAAASPLGRDHAGEAYIVWGGQPRYSSTSFLELETHHDIFVAGAIPSGEYGYATAVGDVNGDGKQDLLIGERGGVGATGGVMAGRAWLLWGDTRQALGSSLDLASFDSRVLRLVGNDAGDQAGYNVEMLDWNDDGRSDMLISAPYARGPNDNHTATGEVYVVYGRARDQLGSSLNLGTQADVVIYGPVTAGQAGLSVSGGDLDGDGTKDLFIGVPGAAGIVGQAEAGQVRALFGPGPASGTSIELATTTDMTFYGETDGDHTGGVVPSPFQQHSIAGLDWDGDGFEDIAIGGVEADVGQIQDAGIVYAYFGRARASLPAQVDLRSSAAVIWLEGPAQDHWVGLNVTGADLDMDGRKDLIVSAPRWEGPGNRTRSGAVMVMNGRPRAQIPQTWGLATDFDLRYIGADPVDLLGIWVATGDVDGDTAPDLVLAACEAAGPNNSIPIAGECYVAYSPTPLGVAGGPPGAIALRYAGAQPARGALELALDLPADSRARVEVMDLQGRRLATLADGPLAAGTHRLFWSGETASGAVAPAGIYIIAVRSPLGRATLRAVLLR